MQLHAASASGQTVDEATQTGCDQPVKRCLQPAHLPVLVFEQKGQVLHIRYLHGPFDTGPSDTVGQPRELCVQAQPSPSEASCGPLPRLPP